MKSIKTYARAAYANRYTFEHVSIDADGEILGHWAETNQKLDPVKLGSINDCRAVWTPTGTRFYNRHILVFTFAPEPKPTAQERPQ